MLISEYFSETRELNAKVYIINDVPVVEYWNSDKLYKIQEFPNNTLQYAEDAAENYVIGVSPSW